LVFTAECRVECPADLLKGLLQPLLIQPAFLRNFAETFACFHAGLFKLFPCSAGG
jgi:hypothetical protein